MAHLMKTVNPGAADKADDLRPLPDISDVVDYYPRPGEVLRGRKRMPALVLHVDHDNRRLDLVVIRGATDWLDQEGVPERVENDRGWLRRDAPPIAGALTSTGVAMQKQLNDVMASIEALRRLVTGDYEDPDDCVLSLLDQMDERVGKIEDERKQPAPVAVLPKRRGRPPKPKVVAPIVPVETETRRRFGRR